MIVVDASAIAELLLRTATGLRVEKKLFNKAESLHAPHLLDIEVLQVLRRSLRSGDMTIALTEALNARLVTCDRALASTPGSAAQVDVVS